MFKTIIQAALKANANRKRRNALTHLSDAALRDIGLTREQARDDNLHGIWDAPDTWKAPTANGVTGRLPRTASIY